MIEAYPLRGVTTEATGPPSHNERLWRHPFASILELVERSLATGPICVLANSPLDRVWLSRFLLFGSDVGQLTTLATLKVTWLRGRDLNPRPSGYEPDELTRLPYPTISKRKAPGRFPAGRNCSAGIRSSPPPFHCQHFSTASCQAYGPKPRDNPSRHTPETCPSGPAMHPTMPDNPGVWQLFHRRLASKYTV